MTDDVTYIDGEPLFTLRYIVDSSECEMFYSRAIKEKWKNQVLFYLSDLVGADRVSTMRGADPQLLTKPTKKGTEMKEGSRFKDALMTTTTSTVSAAKLGAKLEIGNAAITAITKSIKPTLPLMVRGYADTTFGKVVIAGAIGNALALLAPENKRAAALSDALITSSVVKLTSEIDLAAKLEALLNEIDLSALMDGEEK